jgi:hypothetical protein
MMKRLAIALSVLLLLAQLVRAQPTKYYMHDQKVGKGKITTIEKLTPTTEQPTVKEAVPGIAVAMFGFAIFQTVDVPDTAPTTVSLCASEWTCGRCFTDELGRRWCLAQGGPVVEKPPIMKGWLMKGETGLVFFLHESGSLYRRSGDRIIVVP